MVGKTNSKTSSKKPVKKTAPKTASKTASKPTTSKTKTVKTVEKTTSLWKKIVAIIVCILIPLILGLVSAAITGDAMKKFGQFNQPPLAPPAWLFPVAWTALYILMGIASYFILVCKPKTKKENRMRVAALVLYCLQLIINFVWSPVFFVANNYFIALILLLVMWLMIIVIMFLVRERSMPAMWCLLPYALWCLFAMYLNVGILLLN